jgi:hypothetical protein
MQLRCSELVMVSHRPCSWTPDTGLIRIYSVPIGFELSSHQQTISGTGKDVCSRFDFRGKKSKPRRSGDSLRFYTQEYDGWNVLLSL